MGWYSKQLSNRNYLSPGGFKFLLDRSPKTSFLCKTAAIPEISIGVIERGTPFVRIPSEGNIQYGTFSIEFLVDENLENYLEIHNWIRGMGIPEDFEERKEFVEKYTISRLSTNFDIITTDATLQVLNNNLNPAFDIVFKDLFPISLGSLPFDVSVGDIEPVTASVTFRYLTYDIRTVNKPTRIKS
jgi:hypothetical protein